MVYKIRPTPYENHTLGRDVSAHQANAREKGDSLARAETRSHPHETTQGGVTRQPINQISGGGPLSDGLGDKGTCQSIPVFLWASVPMTVSAKERFDRLQIKGGDKALVLFIQGADSVLNAGNNFS